MQTLTKKLSKDMTQPEKNALINAIRDYHSPYLVANDIPLKDFNVKSVFTFEGQRVVGIYDNEFRKAKGFYTELIDSSLTPIDPLRKMYRVAPRDNYKDLYGVTPLGTYAVPFDELEEIIVTVADEEELDLSLSARPFVSDEDAHYTKLTIRDIAAIIWKQPVSQKEFLNQLIESIK